MKTKTILVSGANGYLGLHMARYLRSCNIKVVTAARHDGDFKMNFSYPSEIATLNVNGIDAMIHTVSPNESLYKSDPYYALSEHVSGIHAALDFCYNNKIRDFIYFSSFHVFGSSAGQLKEDTPISPTNDYGLAHSMAEQTIQMFNRLNKINAWVVRPSNLFGVPVDTKQFKRWNLIPFLFCKEAIETNTITLLTSGNQLRNFVGTNDLAEKVMWILKERPMERIVHAYGSQTMSVYDYALIVQKMAQDIYKLPVQIIRPSDVDESYRQFDFSSLHKNIAPIPSDCLSEFVNEMLGVLLAQNKAYPFK
ncbi:NAD(P)-dependent oxidoreductase [Paenibacillus pasadenensis]|uniref:NAD-dependent epimerase/dehydratase family protein n=1 Tax=Paenibacillus pasadenensis TaxID=217090 RepID=UPI00203D5238|nr:NAD(P)-dependent oxidoreductase [Paenibacillus pasadenensis]MCM3750205.1 NAD(P)-dependent oxidoreductase [Paenibacillus pasadenensis]